MKKDPFDEQLDSALEELRESGGDHELPDFERRVWTEIALHEESRWARFARLLREGKSPTPKWVAVGCTAAIVIGIICANLRVASYRNLATKTMEQRYVASIHAVLRSENRAEENNTR